MFDQSIHLWNWRTFASIWKTMKWELILERYLKCACTNHENLWIWYKNETFRIWYNIKMAGVICFAWAQAAGERVRYNPPKNKYNQRKCFRNCEACITHWEKRLIKWLRSFLFVCEMLPLVSLRNKAVSGGDLRNSSVLIYHVFGFLFETTIHGTT